MILMDVREREMTPAEKLQFDVAMTIAAEKAASVSTDLRKGTFDLRGHSRFMEAAKKILERFSQS